MNIKKINFVEYKNIIIIFKILNIDIESLVLESETYLQFIYIIVVHKYKISAI